MLQETALVGHSPCNVDWYTTMAGGICENTSFHYGDEKGNGDYAKRHLWISTKAMSKKSES